MKGKIFSLLVVGLFAGIGTSGMMGQSATAGDQPTEAAKGTSGMNADEKTTPGVKSAAGKPAMTADEAKPTKSEVAAAALKAQYNTAKNKAETVYKGAKAKCDSLPDTAKGSCMKNATAAHTEALAQAKTRWENQLEMNGRPATPTKGDLGKSDTEAKNTH